jgi:hypothetical protein
LYDKEKTGSAKTQPFLTHFLKTLFSVDCEAVSCPVYKMPVLVIDSD